MWHFVICDDEDSARQQVERTFRQALRRMRIPEESYTIVSLSDLAQLQLYPQEPDILLLDIAFQRKDSGMMAAMQLRSRWNHVQFIFVTSMSGFTQGAFHIYAAGYVPKQELNKKMFGAVKDAMDRLNNAPFFSPRIKFRIEGKVHFIPANNILYITPNGHKLLLHMLEPIDGFTAGQYTGTLRDEAKRLSEFGFLHVHKSFIVNLYNVKAMDDGIMTFENGETIFYDRPRDTSIRLAWEAVREYDLHKK